jgi:hypothetical protein
MNTNHLITSDWSNEASRALYKSHWENEPAVYNLYYFGFQCGSCSFYAQFNTDWGLCCNAQSRHHLETTFEHLTCPSHVNEGWGPHSFTSDKDRHCKCEELRDEATL